MTIATTLDGPALSTLQVLDHLGIEKHVLRFWQARVPALVPAMSGGRQFYTTADVSVLRGVKALIAAGQSLRDIGRLIRAEGIEAVRAAGGEATDSGEPSYTVDVPASVPQHNRSAFVEVVRILVDLLRADPAPDVDDVLAQALCGLAERGLCVSLLEPVTATAAAIARKDSSVA